MSGTGCYPAAKPRLNFKPVTKGGRYLDPEAAAEAAEAVKNQGR